MARRRPRVFAEPPASDDVVGVPPSVSAHGHHPIDPYDDFPDGIPVGELGAGPADRWVDAAPPAPVVPPTEAARIAFAGVLGSVGDDEELLDDDELLTAPGSVAAPTAAPQLALPPASPPPPVQSGLGTAAQDLDLLLGPIEGDPAGDDLDTLLDAAPEIGAETGGAVADDELDELDDLFGDDDAVVEAPAVAAPVPVLDGWSEPGATPTPVPPTATGPQPAVYQPPVRRAVDYQRAGQIVDRITTYIGNRPELAGQIAKFVLTRDAELDARQRAELETIVTKKLGDAQLPVTAHELPEILDVVYDELIGLGPLGDPWRDPAVTEILVDGWNTIYVEVGGKLRTTNYQFRSREHAESIARGLAERVSGRSLSPTNPLVTAELPAARVNFAYKPVVRSGLAITLRKLDGVMGMAQLLKYGSLSDEMADFLHDVVAARSAVLVSGGTGVGKTTLLNALSESIGNDERVVTIEDSYELRLANQFVVSMQTKESASGDDKVFVTQTDMLRNSLRMRPDRIIIGEMRDPDAASVMLAAANTGHEGTMTTIHANSADSALNVRLSNLVRSGDDVPTDIARWEIAEAFDIVLQGTRSRFDGQRFVSEIAEVTTDGLEEGGRIQVNPIFKATARPDEPVVFERVGSLRPDGDLAERLLANGVDIARWT